jgi:lysophospholipid acyltransferase
VTQLAFSFTVAPFILLTLPASFLVWARVYFYAVIGTALSTAFFASPAKPYMMRMVSERTGNAAGGLKRTESTESLNSKEPVYGLPGDPSKDLDEAMSEVKAEMEARQRKGKGKAITQ